MTLSETETSETESKRTDAALTDSETSETETSNTCQPSESFSPGNTWTKVKRPCKSAGSAASIFGFDTTFKFKQLASSSKAERNWTKRTESGNAYSARTEGAFKSYRMGM